TATDKNGDYLFTDVEAGVYVLGVQAKGYQPCKKEQVTIKRGEQRQDVSIISAKELQFEVVLDKEVFGVDEPITAMAVLRCSGTHAVTISGLSLEAESLLLEIETLSSGRTVRYIGPFSSSLPPAITIKPGEHISLKLDIGQIAFGNKLELVSGYKISSRGKYALKATYNSWGNQPKRWIGTYQANTIWFEIGTSTTVNNQPNPNEGITAEEVVIPQPQELPASIVQSSDWEMQIAAQDKQITNTAILGMYSTANDGFDAEFDEPLPPAPADNSCIQIYFPHQNWGMIFENFSRDIRGYSSDAVWSFQVKTPSNDTTAALSFSGLPNGYDIILKGIDDNRSWDLRTTDKCDISGRTLYRFELSLKACSTVSTGHTEHTAQTELSHTFGSGWNLISIPVGSNQQASNIFKGISTYYLYEYNHSRQGYGEASMITNGNAYWLGMLGTTTITVEDNQAANDISIPLKPGWNMLGCPFNFTPDWSRVTVKKDGVIKGLTDAVAAGWIINMLYRYVDGGYQASDEMEAWYGYWFASLTDCELIIPKAASANKTTLQAAPLETVNNESWQVDLSVSAGGYQDTANGTPRLGVNPASSIGLDGSDRLELPEPQGNFVTLRFVHPDEVIGKAAVPFNQFDWDIKPPDESIVWDFEVKSNLSGENVAITWDRECLPHDYYLMLIDKDTQTSMVMDEGNGYTYVCGSNNGLPVRHFTVRAAKAASIQVQDEKAGRMDNFSQL
ncbi:MAG: hypothetical protein AAB296_10590, partial [Candidatus Desantisbacteria bacterium]